MGVKNDIFWSEIGSGFGEPGSTLPPRIPKSTPCSSNAILTFTSHLEETAGIDPDYSYLSINIFP